jgi:hypothetical protein
MHEPAQQEDLPAGYEGSCRTERSRTIMAEPADAVDPVARIDELRGVLARLREEAATLRPAAERALGHAEQLRQAREQRGPGGPTPLRERLAEVEHELDGLQTAMRTRAVIEQAKGMIMLRDHCDADAAFDTLVDTSQRSHRKLHEVATMVVGWAQNREGA